VVPAVFSLFIYNYLTKDTLREQALSNANRELSIAAEYVGKLMEDMLYVANFIQVDAELNTILKNEAKNGLVEDPSQKYQRFIDESKINKTINNITFVGEKSYVTILLNNGKSYTNYPRYDYNPKDLVNEEWFAHLEGIRGYQSVWIETQPTVFKSEKTNNPYQLSVARTLRDENLNIYGYVIVTIMENKINQIFENIKGYEDMTMLDSSNRILSNREDSKIGTSFEYTDQLIEGNSSNIFQISEEPYLIAERKVALTDWKLVSVIPYKQAVSKIDSIFSKIFMIQILSFGIFLLLLGILLRTVTRPLVTLGKVAEEVQQGNLKLRSGIQSEDEIGRLSISFDQMLDRINEMIREITDSQERKRRAELAMLQAQINPHFLFNVLNSIRMKVFVKGDRESADMISTLSKLLRMTIEKDKEMIPLHEELQIGIDYVQIMNLRQRENVKLEISVHEELKSFLVPRFILQPIVENSIIHGLNQSEGTIKISTKMNINNGFVIVVEDNGQGMFQEELERLHKRVLSLEPGSEDTKKAHKGFSSLGLSNVFERMYMTFGPSFAMDIKSSRGQGTQVILTIPGKGRLPNVQSDVS
jgi:two-component system sensor histidine kinase YesM